MLYDVTTGKITAEDVLRPGGRWGDCEIWDGLPMVRLPTIPERGFIPMAPDLAPVLPEYRLSVGERFEGL